MKPNELADILILILVFFIIIFLLNYLLKHSIKPALKPLFFKCGIFIFASILAVWNPIFLDFLNINQQGYYTKMLIAILWWLSLSLLINELITFFLWNKFMPKKGITVSELLRDIVALLLFIITLALIFHFVFDKSVVGLFTASGVMAIILGYSAQSTLSEAFAGIGLNIAKQYEQGDWIEILNNNVSLRGQVVQINWRFVTLLTSDHIYMTIPNSEITKKTILNRSKPNDHSKITIPIQIHSEISPDTIKTMLVLAAQHSVYIDKEPKPYARFVKFNNSNINDVLLSTYELYCYGSSGDQAMIRDDVLSAFWYQNKRRDSRVLNKIDAIIPAPKDYLSFLQKIILFSSLTEEELEQIIADSKWHLYGPPEIILTQGQKNTSLFLIYKGKVHVSLKKDSGEEETIATLEDGGYFGEMSLLTGKPITASISAANDSIILEINHKIMGKIFTNRPELVEKISAIVVLRKEFNDSILSTESIKVAEQESLIQKLASNIKHFFTMDK